MRPGSWTLGKVLALFVSMSASETLSQTQRPYIGNQENYRENHFVGKEIQMIHEVPSSMIPWNAKNFKSMTCLIDSFHISEFMRHSHSVFWWPNSKPHDYLPVTVSGVDTWLLLANALCQPWIYYLYWKDKREQMAFCLNTGGPGVELTDEASRWRGDQNMDMSLMGFSSQVALVSWWPCTSMLLIAAFDLPSVPWDASFSFLRKQKKPMKVTHWHGHTCCIIWATETQRVYRGSAKWTA